MSHVLWSEGIVRDEGETNENAVRNGEDGEEANAASNRAREGRDVVGFHLASGPGRHVGGEGGRREGRRRETWSSGT